MSSPSPLAQSRKPTTLKTVVALMLREMATTYGRSPGGFVWAVAEPAAAIGLLSVALSIAFSAPPLGKSFVLFYATGYLPFMLFVDLSGKLSQALRINKPLLEYPAVTFIDALCSRFVLNLLVNLVVTAVVVSVVIVIWAPRTVVDFPVFLHALAMSAGLGVGVGTLNCYLFMAFPIWESVWRIVMRPLFILSGILFLYETVPDDYQWIFWMNPLFHAIAEARKAFYPAYDATFVSPVFVWAVVAVTLALGLLLLRPNYRSLLLK